MEGRRDRCAGLLIGLAAGDRNGGPLRLALRLLHSLLEQKNFNREHVLAKYFDYFRGPPYDVEKAFDTGHTFYSVFRSFSQGVTILEAAQQVQLKFGSKGVGAAHRNIVLAMAPFISDKELSGAAEEESYLTHANRISSEVSIFVNALCRSLLLHHPDSLSWEECIQVGLASVEEREVREAVLSSSSCERRSLSRDGYAPKVLQAALYFLHSESNFEGALNASLSFAGPPNYCPVLVGAIGGAKYGGKAILGSHTSPSQNPLLRHCSTPLLTQLLSLANDSANTWTQ